MRDRRRSGATFLSYEAGRGGAAKALIREASMGAAEMVGEGDMGAAYGPAPAPMTLRSMAASASRLRSSRPTVATARTLPSRR